MKKTLFIILALIIIGFSSYYAFVYYNDFSDGHQTGKLVKFSRKGVIFKTWEGKLSYGVSYESTFLFSVLDNQTETIKKLKELQGQTVDLSYIERYKTFPWWGDSKHFANNVKQLENTKSSEETEKLKDLIEENEQLKERVIELKKTIEDLRTTVNILKESSNN